jgi:hypothetical protein
MSSGKGISVNLVRLLLFDPIFPGKRVSFGWQKVLRNPTRLGRRHLTRGLA